MSWATRRGLTEAGISESALWAASVPLTGGAGLVMAGTELELDEGEQSTCCDWLGTWCPWGDCDEAAAEAWAADVAEAEGSPQIVVEKGDDGEFYVTSEVAPDGTVTEVDPVKLTDATAPEPAPATEEPEHTEDAPPESSPPPPPGTYAPPRRPSSRAWLWPAVIGGAGALLLGAALISRRK